MGLCACGSGLESSWFYDGRGIELFKACDECEEKQMSKYRPEVLVPYDESTVDEQIEPEE